MVSMAMAKQTCLRVRDGAMGPISSIVDEILGGFLLMVLS